MQDKNNNLANILLTAISLWVNMVLPGAWDNCDCKALPATVVMIFGEGARAGLIDPTYWLYRHMYIIKYISGLLNVRYKYNLFIFKLSHLLGSASHFLCRNRLMTTKMPFCY